MKNYSILSQDTKEIANSINVEDIVTDFLEKERRRAIRGTFSSGKKKDPFYLLNEKYRVLLSKQVSQSLEVKKAVFEQALKAVKGISRDGYLSALRDITFNRLLANFKFMRDCLELKLNPFNAALNIAMAGAKQVDKVLTLGIEVVYGSDVDSLKDAIFSEKELAHAKFSSVSNVVSNKQLTEAQRLISAMEQVLNLVETEQK
ncbi:hypothetical protein [Odoribacter laneus]|uniref:Uncharacterized protein n=1 Tax=Odoribacter laneus YIT 12061 TaxID=742817 RepID=H1DF08_9BACT|nr:hypothetical protein [Odoribacter laneus]EHP49326.1 hypothetical protein HMPREF9449_00844 [Odoribacter laneus YIT 12061]